MALLITQLSGNKARIGGGAVFAGYLEAIRIRCSDASTDSSLSSNKDRDWKSLRSIKSVNDVCPSWKDNNARLYGPVIATYAVSAQMVIEDATNSGCESGEEGCAIESYRAGTELPAATVELVDRLDQKPATSDQPVSAIMSSKGGRFLTGSFVLEMKKGSCSFKHIEAFVPPGKYQLTVEFDKKEIKSIDIRVSVRECFVGESLSSAGICVDCSSTTYSFPPSKNDCQSCPENGNCTSQAITPNDGYWQKTPCSDRLYRCLPTAACEFEGRSNKLSEAVSDVTKCSFEESEIEDYMDAQCAEVSCVLSDTSFLNSCLIPKGLRRSSLWVLFGQLRIWLVLGVQGVPESALQCDLHCDVGSLSLGTDGHHDSWHAQRIAWRNETDS